MENNSDPGYKIQDALNTLPTSSISYPVSRNYRMFTHDTQIRVRYAETDQMGVVYHSNYFPWFEASRVEALRSLGFRYADMEKMGIIMPVVDVHCRYLRPAKYDELLTVRTTLKELPIHHKIEFFNDVYNEQNELLASAKIILYFMEAKTMKRTTMPSAMFDTLQPYFKHSKIES